MSQASTERVQGRVYRLLAQEKKMTERLSAESPMSKLFSSKRKAYQAKLEEIKASLNNMMAFGQEYAPTGRPVGVDIGVPLKKGAKP